MNIVQIAIADQERNFRTLLAKRLASERSMRVVGTAEDGWELLPLIQGRSPDILVMDLALNHGLVLLPYIHQRKNSLKIRMRNRIEEIFDIDFSRPDAPCFYMIRCKSGNIFCAESLPVAKTSRGKIGICCERKHLGRSSREHTVRRIH